MKSTKLAAAIAAIFAENLRDLKKAALHQWKAFKAFHAQPLGTLGVSRVSSDYTLADLNRYDVNYPDSAEKVRQRLYDFLVYPTAGVAQLSFFVNPKGQGLSSSPGNANNAKAYSDTNMDLAGQLPSPQAMIVESIEVLIFAGSSTVANTYASLTPMEFNATPAATVDANIGDVNAIGVAGWLEFYIGSKVYVRDAPIGVFPPKTYLDLDAAVAIDAASTTTSSMASIANAKWAGRPYYLDPPITLRATQNFQVTLNFPAVVATPSGANARIGVALDGVLFRKAQ